MTGYVTRHEAAKYVGLSAQTLARIAATRTDGPIYRVIGNRARYKISDLDAWLEAIAKPRRSSREAIAA